MRFVALVILVFGWVGVAGAALFLIEDAGLQATTADGVNWIPGLAGLLSAFLVIGVGGVLDRLVMIEQWLRPIEADRVASIDGEPAAPKIGLL